MSAEVEEISEEIVDTPPPPKKTKKPLSAARLAALARGRATRLANLARKREAKASQKVVDRDAKSIRQQKERSEKAKKKYAEKKLAKASPEQVEKAVEKVEKVQESLSIHQLDDAGLTKLLSDLKNLMKEKGLDNGEIRAPVEIKEEEIKEKEPVIVGGDEASRGPVNRRDIPDNLEVFPNVINDMGKEQNVFVGTQSNDIAEQRNRPVVENKFATLRRQSRSSRRARFGRRRR